MKSTIIVTALRLGMVSAADGEKTNSLHLNSSAANSTNVTSTARRLAGGFVNCAHISDKASCEASSWKGGHCEWYTLPTERCDFARGERRRAWQVFPPTQCSDVAETCTNGCGDYARFPGQWVDDGTGNWYQWYPTSAGGSATPYQFMPNVDNKDCSWTDGADSAWQSGQFLSSPFQALSDPYSYQAFGATHAGATDVWVMHFCDGSGVQTDCAGDVYYLEHFDDPNPVPEQDCPVSVDGDKYQCPTFYHPGKDMVLPGYSCGWWRGYNYPVGIEEASWDGVGGNKQTGFGPVPSPGWNSDYGPAIKAILENCPTCSYGSGLVHPYWESNAKAYFVGAIYPWICMQGDDSMIPYTGYNGNDMKCFCDNEPWNGRQLDGNGVDPEIPRNAEIVYCGLYDAEDPNDKIKLVCDFIRFDWEHGMAYAEDPANGLYKGVEMYPTGF